LGDSFDGAVVLFNDVVQVFVLAHQDVNAGIETVHMIKKGQMNCPDGQTMSAANQFYSLAA